ncbi:hypothetical protein TEA_018165 [Camellia sinensis var. sinensis]|uniref:O-fucosyltransferase family protein n=1 Tax=Camellia sinensis var. sinensis TaxID=542762 RepID=A0A4V3WQK2_CAMSN|nr:hypothetical protein TEA_018165 [Camellia sinensis var. sinensis]
MESLNFNNRTNIRWKKKPPLRSPTSLLPISLFFLPISLLLFLFYKHISNSLLSTLKNSPQPQSPDLCTSQKTLAREKFLWYAPHSRFSNQLSEFKYAILMAAILNRTLIVPLVLDHHAVVLGNEDCTTTVWTYGKDGEDGTLDSFQPDEQLKKKNKISYVRKRQNVYQMLGPGSRAELATVLAFGSLFTTPYRGKEFASKTIKSPFLCAQLRLLDGQFKNHWKTTFLGLQ